jgi:anaerobic selenocysteine-containing dehydrogenase
MTPKVHTRFLNSSYSHLPKHGPLEGGPYVEVHADDADALGLTDVASARVWNDRAVTARCASVTVSDPASRSLLVGGQHAGGSTQGPVANSLTNDTLTDWGGGVAFWDTRVALAPA